MSDHAAELRKRILADVAAVSSPTRTEARRKDVATLLFAIVCVAGVALMRGFPAFAEPHGLGFTAAVVLVPIAAAVVGLSLLRRRPGTSLSMARQSLLLGGAIGPLAIGGGYILATLGLSMPVRAHTGFLADGMCAVVLLCTGLVVLAALVRSEGRSEPVSPGARGLAAGGVVAAAVGAALAFQCPESSFLHYGFGHFVPALVLVAMGGLLGRGWLAPRWAAAKQSAR